MQYLGQKSLLKVGRVSISFVATTIIRLYLSILCEILFRRTNSSAILYKIFLSSAFERIILSLLCSRIYHYPSPPPPPFFFFFSFFSLIYRVVYHDRRSAILTNHVRNFGNAQRKIFLIRSFATLLLILE
jgi:hypothetical protein